MLEINGHKFAKNDKEAIESVFSLPTVYGYYRKYKKSLLLMDHQKKAIACLIANPSDSPYFVDARNTSNGIRYSFGTSIKTNKMLGTASFKEQIELAKQVWTELDSHARASLR